MYKLRMLFHDGSQVPGADVGTDGQVKMYGVKIIESLYVPEGTIFKVFKNQDQMLYSVSPISGSISYPVTHNGSGVIPGWSFSKDQKDDMFPMTTTIDTEEVTTKQITENMKKALEAVDKVISEPVPPGISATPIPGPQVTETQDEKKTEPVDTRHSTKRRIELEE